MEMDIKAVKTYQAVEFQNKLESFFIKNAQKKMSDLKITVIEHLGVRLSSAKDDIIVPFANIAGIYLKHRDAVEQVKAELVETVEVKPEAESTEEELFEDDLDLE